MSMVQLGDLTARNPFHDYICDGCGKTMGRHYIFRPDKLTDVHGGAGARQPNGKFYCQRDGTTSSPGHFQRQLRRTMVPGYQHV